MELIIIRHTTPDIEKGICYGQSDIGVATSFHNEVRAIKKQLPTNLEDYQLYASPLKRCKKLATALSTNVIFDKRLQELYFGDWELKRWGDIDKHELEFWMAHFVTEPTKNGESYQELHQRTTEFIKELLAKKHSKVILITHAGVIRSIWAYAHHIPLNESFNLKLSYGEVISLNLSS